MTSTAERYCAWFGHVSGSVLYFGESPFWSAYRAGGDDPGDQTPPAAPSSR